MASLNETTIRPEKLVESANGASGFRSELPFASFRRAGLGRAVFTLAWRSATRCSTWRPRAPTCEADWDRALGEPRLNALMALAPTRARRCGWRFRRALREGSALAGSLRAALVPIEVGGIRLAREDRRLHRLLHLDPSRDQRRQLFRPDNPLLPNYKWVPIGYHGRASTIDVSGATSSGRAGRQLPPNARSRDSAREAPRLRAGDGVYIGAGNAQGEPIPDRARPSATSSASRCSTIGPRATSRPGSTSRWGPSLEELRDHDLAVDRDARGAGTLSRGVGSPADDGDPLPYLIGRTPRAAARSTCARGALETKKHGGWRSARASPVAHELSLRLLDRGAAGAHHTVNGCALVPGDILGTGTLSGPSPDQLGSLAELTQGGKQSLTLGNGEVRTFLRTGTA
jgi:fumarylacetoacetase